MVRDEDWFDAVGKDLWRWEQELKEIEKNELQKKECVPLGRVHNQESTGIHSQEPALLTGGSKDSL